MEVVALPCFDCLSHHRICHQSIKVSLVRELKPFVDSVIERVVDAPARERGRLEGILRVTLLDLEYLANETRQGRGIAETLATQELLVESIDLGYQSIEYILEFLETGEHCHLARSLELVQTSDDVLQAVRALIQSNKTQLAQHSVV